MGRGGAAPPSTSCSAPGSARTGTGSTPSRSGTTTTATPLELAVEDASPIVLGPAVAAGQVPQAIVPAGAWQSARSLGAFTLVGCTVSPAFRFEGFELAPDGWSP